MRDRDREYVEELPPYAVPIWTFSEPTTVFYVDKDLQIQSRALERGPPKEACPCGCRPASLGEARLWLTPVENVTKARQEELLEALWREMPDAEEVRIIILPSSVRSFAHRALVPVDKEAPPLKGIFAFRETK